MHRRRELRVNGGRGDEKETSGWHLSLSGREREIEGGCLRRGAVWPCNYGQTAQAEREREKWKGAMRKGRGVGGLRGGAAPRTNPIILAGPPLVCLYNYPVALLRWGPDGAPVPIRRPVRHFVRSMPGHNADIIT